MQLWGFNNASIQMEIVTAQQTGEATPCRMENVQQDNEAKSQTVMQNECDADSDFVFKASETRADIEYVPLDGGQLLTNADHEYTQMHSSNTTIEEITDNNHLQLNVKKLYLVLNNGEPSLREDDATEQSTVSVTREYNNSRSNHDVVFDAAGAPYKQQFEAREELLMQHVSDVVEYNNAIELYAQIDDVDDEQYEQIDNINELVPTTVNATQYDNAVELYAQIDDDIVHSEYVTKIRSYDDEIHNGLQQDIYNYIDSELPQLHRKYRKRLQVLICGLAIIIFAIASISGLYLRSLFQDNPSSGDKVNQLVQQALGKVQGVKLVWSANLTNVSSYSKINAISDDIMLVSCNRVKLPVSFFIYKVINATSAALLTTVNQVIAKNDSLLDAALSPSGHIVYTTIHTQEVVIITSTGLVITRHIMTQPMYISVSPSDNAIYVATANASVHRSTDEGQTWQQVYHNSNGSIFVCQAFKVFVKGMDGVLIQEVQGRTNIEPRYRSLRVFALNSDGTVYVHSELSQMMSFPPGMMRSGEKNPHPKMVCNCFTYDNRGNIFYQEYVRGDVHVRSIETPGADWIQLILPSDDITYQTLRGAVLDTKHRSLYVGQQHSNQLDVYKLNYELDFMPNSQTWASDAVIHTAH